MNFAFRFALIALAVALLYYVVKQYSGNLPLLNDGAVTMNVPMIAQAPEMKSSGAAMDLPVAGNPEDISGTSIDRVNWDGIAENQLAGSLSKQYQELSADELLPSSEHSNWADIYPEGNGQLQGKNFLNAAHHVGINTVGQHLKNANMQLRSEPSNPQISVSPWLQSSYGPDLLRKTFEVGGCE